MTKKRQKRSPFDIAILATAILAICAVVGGLIASGVTSPEGPPDLRASVTNKLEDSSGGRMFEITVRNEGGSTAEQIQVEVTLGEEKRSLVIAAIARNDEEVGSVVFPSGTPGEPKVEVQAFSEPMR